MIPPQIHFFMAWKKLIPVLFFGIGPFASFGQNSQVSKQDSLVPAKDTSGYQQAVYWAKKGQHDTAEKICRAILKKDPQQVRTEVLLGRLYSWDRKFDSARIFLKDAITRQPDNEEALQAIINLELWSGQLDQAWIYCNEALSRYPRSEKLLIKKAKLYNKQAKYKEAYQTVQQVLQINPANREALEFEKYLKGKLAARPEKNAIGLSYQYDHFSQNYAPWTYASLYFLHKARGGNLSAGVNYANRFQTPGVQYQLNWYPRISSSMKAFLGAAYSKDSILPGWDLGAGLSHTLFKKAELEAGVRRLTFSSLPDPIILYTGALNLSFHRFWISARTYLATQQGGLNQSYYLTTRYYGKNPGSNLTLILTSGFAPHDYFDPNSGKAFSYSNRSERIRLGYQTTFFSPKNILKLSTGYERRSYYSGLILERITAGLGIERWFLSSGFVNNM